MNKVDIRAWESGDAVWLAQHFNNEKIWNNLRDYVPYPYTLENAEKFIITQQELTPTQNFAITDDGEIVGGIGINFQHDIYRMNVELGYWI
ncbi:MAG: GNAT family N-acetyltransferase [Bacteroidetes bacterium]|nr:GNAT family N-acetyltransferase [Bacteroidota bacterium]